MRGVSPIEVDPDICRAETLPASAVTGPDAHRALTERVLARSWHLVDATDPVPEKRALAPRTLLEGSLDEPIVWSRDDDGALHCLSNVCTHRANVVVAAACKAASLRCRYHGRRFSLDGRFAFMPEFEGAEGFPSPQDDLPRVPSAAWGPLHFASLDPAQTFDAWLGPLRERLAFVPWDALELAEPPRSYELRASWVLYCDNYLEGFHIPFVHAGLAEALDYGAYETELHPWGTLQIGIAKDGDDVLDLPASHPDHGRRVAALYAFLHPATMINVYPWGLSVNAVRPAGPDRTQIAYYTLVHDPSRRGRGAGGDLHAVELEDDAIVESVQRGIRSRLYRGGRFSPKRETGVHHFHRLLAAQLGGLAGE